MFQPLLPFPPFNCTPDRISIRFLSTLQLQSWPAEEEELEEGDVEERGSEIQESHGPNSARAVEKKVCGRRKETGLFTRGLSCSFFSFFFPSVRHWQPLSNFQIQGVHSCEEGNVRGLACVGVTSHSEKSFSTDKKSRETLTTK